MTTTITEEGLAFNFPDGWEATKYDNWAYYRNQFQNTCDSKAVDILALEPGGGTTLWIIEIKVLYLDSDIIINASIKEMFDIDISDYYLAAIGGARFNRHEELKMRSDAKYFNSGIMLINMKKWTDIKSPKNYPLHRFIKTMAVYERPSLQGIYIGII